MYNGHIRNVLLSGSITDSVAGVAWASYVVEDEYNEIQPSGNIYLSPDGAFHLNIPVEDFCNGSDEDGRVYIVHITTMDNVGNISTATATIKY